MPLLSTDTSLGSLSFAAYHSVMMMIQELLHMTTKQQHDGGKAILYMCKTLKGLDQQIRLAQGARAFQWIARTPDTDYLTLPSRSQLEC